MMALAFLPDFIRFNPVTHSSTCMRSARGTSPGHDL